MYYIFYELICQQYTPPNSRHSRTCPNQMFFNNDARHRKKNKGPMYPSGDYGPLENEAMVFCFFFTAVLEMRMLVQISMILTDETG